MNPIIPIIDATIDPKFEFLPFFFDIIIMPKVIEVIPEIRTRIPVKISITRKTLVIQANCFPISPTILNEAIDKMAAVIIRQVKVAFVLKKAGNTEAIDRMITNLNDVIREILSVEKPKIKQ